MTKEKIPCIIDTDPGVDDSAAICLTFYDDLIDIVLMTTVVGNLGIEKVTRNALHLLDKFERADIPLAKGATKALCRQNADATFMHQKEGLGKYLPPETTIAQPIKLGAVEAMYKTIKKYAGKIVIIELGPHTNLATLIQKHPDVVGMIKHIYTEGCSPYGWKSEGRWKDYISFNASSDPEAWQITMQSGIPTTLVPSRAGREMANFDEQEIYALRDMNSVGKFLYTMYSAYWEPRYPDKRIATNDTCAIMSLRFPRLFKTKRVAVEINTTDAPGRTTMKLDKNSHIHLVVGINKQGLHQKYFSAVKKLDRFTF